MGENILLVIVLLLSLYGCVELIRLIVYRLLRPHTKFPGVLVVPIAGRCTEMEYFVRMATARNYWSYELANYIVLIDNGMDQETQTLAKKLCQQYDDVFLSKPEEFEKIFADGLQ